MLPNAAEAIKKYRKENNLKQVELAKMLGVSQTVISDLENGLEPSKRVARKLSRLLKLPIDYFIGVDDDDQGCEMLTKRAEGS